MTTTHIERSLVDFIINGLKKAAGELEELQVQIALGKAEAKDLFENVKKELHTQIQQLKLKIRLAKTNEDVLPVVNALEHLQVQLALGLAESKEAFEEQRRNIEQSLHELESRLKHGAPGRQVARIQLEIEKFKAKLQLISLGYQLKKISLEYDLKQKRTEFEHKLASIKTKLSVKEEHARNKWQHYKDEIKDAFDHLRSTFLPLD
jgi:hypothetical protein